MGWSEVAADCSEPFVDAGFEASPEADKMADVGIWASETDEDAPTLPKQ